MLLPRFSIKTLLAALTGAAIISLFAGQALGGRAWAFGVTMGVLSVPAALLVHAMFFGLASLYARVIGPEDIVAHTSRGGIERSSAALATADGEMARPIHSTPATP